MPKQHTKNLIPSPIRFWTKVDFNGPVPKDCPELGPCWLWTGAANNGYGKFGQGLRRLVYTHRWAYEFCVGPIPEGLTLDHLCRTPPCVRPDHLEPVTLQENLLRSPVSLAAINARKTHCPQGHSYNTENTYITPCSGGRSCRTCIRLRATAWRARKVGR